MIHKLKKYAHMMAAGIKRHNHTKGTLYDKSNEVKANRKSVQEIFAFPI